jgi:hypothetical protein
VRLPEQLHVLLLAVTSIPKDAKDVTPDGDVILAYGEVTGKHDQQHQAEKIFLDRRFDRKAEDLEIGHRHRTGG